MFWAIFLSKSKSFQLFVVVFFYISAGWESYITPRRPIGVQEGRGGSHRESSLLSMVAWKSQMTSSGMATHFSEPSGLGLMGFTGFAAFSCFKLEYYCKLLYVFNQTCFGFSSWGWGCFPKRWYHFHSSRVEFMMVSHLYLGKNRSKLNPKPCGYINLHCCADRSHIWLHRQPIGEREALRHAPAVVGSSEPTLRKS